jgi:hypothetical protein
MSELAATAERLRVVKEACLDFITLWAINRMMEEDGGRERMHGDALGCSDNQHSQGFVQSDRYLDD